MTVAQVLGGTSATPTVTTERLTSTPTYSGTASEMMGACGSGPAQGVQNGFACNRSTDVWGIALDHACNLVVSWPSLSSSKDATLGATTDATWVDTQVGGPTLCASGAVAGTAAQPGTGSTPAPPAPAAAATPNTAGPGAGEVAVLASLTALLATPVIRRRRRR